MRILGLVGSALGLILAILGIAFLISTGNTLGIIVLVVGVVLLALGAWAYRGSTKAKVA